jgi:ABC-type antimicrobial peptide transport system permease subunit
VYASYWQPPNGDAFLNDARMMVRTAGDPALILPAIRKAIAALDPNVPVQEDAPMRERLSHYYQPVRLARTMMVGFAVLAVLLSAVGVYGVLAFSVAQRTRELAIRSALGATRANVAGLVLRDGAVMTATGVAIGLGAAWASGRFLAGFLYGIQPDNTTAFVAGAAVIGLVAMIASGLPARRAAAVSASAALRCE